MAGKPVPQTIHVRLDDGLRAQLQGYVDEMGVSSSGAVRLLLGLALADDASKTSVAVQRASQEAARHAAKAFADRLHQCVAETLATLDAELA